MKIMDPFYPRNNSFKINSFILELEPDFLELLCITYPCFYTSIEFLEKLISHFKKMRDKKGSVSAAKSRIR
jgi:hypothetical protein